MFHLQQHLIIVTPFSTSVGGSMVNDHWSFKVSDFTSLPATAVHCQVYTRYYLAIQLSIYPLNGYFWFILNFNILGFVKKLIRMIKYTDVGQGKRQYCWISLTGWMSQ